MLGWKPNSDTSPIAGDNVFPRTQMAKYFPAPINTVSVTLPEQLERLIERLAENTHEVWAAQRIAQGWTYGPARDDPTKRHPCLVPYNELSEAEKDYDRQTATQTLKAILTLGYQITPPPEIS
jgi:ryanodine receptor 2